MTPGQIPQNLQCGVSVLIFPQHQKPNINIWVNCALSWSASNPEKTGSSSSLQVSLQVLRQLIMEQAHSAHHFG